MSNSATGDGQFRHRNRFGADIVSQGLVRFSFWAPGVRHVVLELARSEGEEFERLEMHNTGEGHFVLETACHAGAVYRYRISDELSVPDPAARAQKGDVDGPSRVVDPSRYVWRHTRWSGRPWHEAVILEVHAGALGGFSGLRTRLEAWAALGITAIELMPVNAFPGKRNWGYDGVLPYAVDSTYGSPDELKGLIDDAHGHGLMVMLDVVYNHFGPDGNYLSHYAPSFFTGKHTPWGDAIDFDQPEVSDYFIDNALMWLMEYRFDGLRLDAVHAIDNDEFLRTLQASVHEHVEPGRQVHLVLENERNSASLLEDGFDAQWNDDFHNVLHTLLTGEKEGYYADYADDATNKLAASLAGGFVFQGQADRRGHARGEPSRHLPTTSFITFLQNHDQVGNRALGERLIHLAEPSRLRAATTLLLLCPMIPMLFMGEEQGETAPFFFFTDHKAELADAVREGRRGEFAEFEAFKNEDARNAIPDPNAAATFDDSCPGLVGDKSWAALYSTLLSLRHRHLVPRLSGTWPEGATVLGEGAVQAIWRLSDHSAWVMAINLGSEAVHLSASAGDVVHDTHPDADMTSLMPGRCIVWQDGSS
ncbi:malto-oligosyltrehalose trehalohydrolase [Larsenimonas rhizosphaerae]|uniref:Malto-oligosyltrehalose trehalohydrolase n=1 Tax=Larsenimonas rhizosphaerae TaxID=2944682 RepID=A0AA42CWR7_9GAMM|nr:malto-oligosyltrehalose trehalohydrolase [Larsenimonas rhizosphaerae]MCX2522953.1 malto-oligosyltrehalose trehalohydrolase [Larsenimonas rhizosphaerae]